jgi:hypothetical protein
MSNKDIYDEVMSAFCLRKIHRIIRDLEKPCMIEKRSITSLNLELTSLGLIGSKEVHSNS